MSKINKVPLNVRISPELNDRAHKAADKDLRTWTNFIERAIQLYTDRVLNNDDKYNDK